MLNFRPEIECKRENYGNKKKVFYHDATILKMMTTLIFFLLLNLSFCLAIYGLSN